jgi:NAD(P)H-flavin reductase
VYEFAFEKPQNFSFKAGQFVLFDVPLIDKLDDIQTRAMSIASSPDENELLFVAKLIEGGRASRWIEEKLKPGDTMRIQGPLGFFTLQEGITKEYLFICTSTGAAPFRSQIRTALKSGDTRRMDLIFGARTEEDLFWQKEFEELSHEYPNFFLHFALSNPSESWAGHRGRVQTLVPQIVKDFSNKHVYVCGNPDMTTEVKKLCLDQWGIGKKDLHVEGYI